MGSTLNPYKTVMILEQPVPICPAYRPIRFKVSTTVTTDELQMKGEIYTRATPDYAWTLRATKMERRYLNENYFVFNFEEVLQSLLSLDRVDSGDAFALQTQNDGAVVEYKVLFTEVYNDGNGFPAAYNTLWSVVKVAVNATKQIDETDHLAAYTIQDAVTRDFSDDFSSDFK